jgi:hypothetical protein
MNVSKGKGIPYRQGHISGYTVDCYVHTIRNHIHNMYRVASVRYSTTAYNPFVTFLLTVLLSSIAVTYKSSM